MQPLRARFTRSGSDRETTAVGAGCEVYSRWSRAPISESVRVRRMRAVVVRVPVLIEETASVDPQGRQALNSAGAGYGKNEDRVGRSRNEDRVGRRQSVEQAAHSQQRWQPLEDGRWSRVVGRVGAGR